MAKEFDDLKDRPASSLRDYLSGYQESAATFRWIWRDMVSPRTKRWAKIFTGIIFIQVIVEMLTSLPARYLLDGAIAKDTTLIMWSMVAYATFQIALRLINWIGLYVRNHIATGNFAGLDHRLNQLFFEKFLGQHMQQSGYLSSASMEKGRNRVINVEELTVNEALGTVFGISVAYILLWCFSAFAGSVATVLLLSTACWSLYLNRQVMINCLPTEREFRAYNQYRGERWDHVE